MTEKERLLEELEKRRIEIGRRNSMNKRVANIYYNNTKYGKDYDGDGPYVLVFGEKAIGSHYCSNRSFANHDLTEWQLESLKKNKIDEVYSNGVLVWSNKENEVNDKTSKGYKEATVEYERKYCNG